MHDEYGNSEVGVHVLWMRYRSWRNGDRLVVCADEEKEAISACYSWCNLLVSTVNDDLMRKVETNACSIGINGGILSVCCVSMEMWSF